MSQDARGSSPERAQQDISDLERCTYIAEMCLELRDLAPRSRLRDLNYLLDLARAEAEYVIKQLQNRGGPH